MLTRRIIPCLDVDRGRVVTGVKFFDHVDAADPVEQARRYQDAGIEDIGRIAEVEARGADEIGLIVMNARGTVAGYDLEMAVAVRDAVNSRVVAARGVGRAQRMPHLLTIGRADAALAASIFL